MVGSAKLMVVVGVEGVRVVGLDPEGQRHGALAGTVVDGGAAGATLTQGADLAAGAGVSGSQGEVSVNV